MNKTLSLLFILTGIVLMSCNNKSIDIKIVDSTHGIEISVGDTLNLIFDANPSTGYQWGIENSDSFSIQQIDKIYIADNNNENIVGRGGNLIISYKGLKQSEIIINAKYARPFIIDSPPNKESTVFVKIK